MPYFSIIIPVYNRPDEVNDLLESLSKQTYKDFEVIIVEDGSTVCCADAVKRYSRIVDIHYYYKENEGRSIARNYGLERAVGSYFILFVIYCLVSNRVELFSGSRIWIPGNFEIPLSSVDNAFCLGYGAG